MEIFVAVISLISIVIAFWSFRAFCYWFFALLAFSPRYLSIALGASASTLSLRRILLVSSMLVFTGHLLMNRRRAIRAITSLKLVIIPVIFIAMYILAEFASTLLNGSPGSVLYFIDDALNMIVPILLAAYLAQEDNADIQIAKVLLVSLIITAGLAIFEMILGHPILSGLASVAAYIRFHDPLAGRFRNGDYRVMAGFESALLLGAFLSATMWISASYLRYRRKTLLAIIVILVCCLDIYFTDSRAAMLATVLAGPICIILYMMKHMRQKQRAGFVLSIILLVSIVALFGYFSVFVPYLRSLQFATDQASDSTSQRLDQFVNVWHLLVHRPILGYGAMQTYVGDLSDLNSIDNYYLKSLLQAGLIGLFSTIMIRASMLIMLIVSFVKSELQNWHLGFILSCLVYSMSDFFVSQNSNHPYLIGLSIIVLLTAKNKQLMTPSSL
jgi:O-antigen ligase